MEKIESYSEILVPIAFSFPRVGEFVPFLFILFVAWFYGNTFGAEEQLKLAAIGIPSLFGGTESLISIHFPLKSTHLPADAYDLYITMGIFRSSVATALACMALFSFTVISMALILRLCKFHLRKIVLTSAFMVCIFAIIVFGLKLGFVHIVQDSYHGNEIISVMELSRTADGKLPSDLVQTTVY